MRYPSKWAFFVLFEEHRDIIYNLFIFGGRKKLFYEKHYSDSNRSGRRQLQQKNRTYPFTHHFDSVLMMCNRYVWLSALWGLSASSLRPTSERFVFHFSYISRSLVRGREKGRPFDRPFSYSCCAVCDVGYLNITISLTMVLNILLSAIKFSTLGSLSPRCHLYIIRGDDNPSHSCICATVIPFLTRRRLMFSPVATRSICSIFIKFLVIVV